MKKIIFFLFTAAIFFTSCKKGFSLNDNSSSSQDYISFSMLNQNIVYSDSSKSNPDSLIAFYYNGITDTSLLSTNTKKIYALALFAIRAKDTSLITLLIEGLSPVTTAKYNFIDSVSLNDSDGLAQPKFFGVSYSIDTTTAYAYIDETQTTGYVQITNFDLSNKIVEGTFLQNNCAKYNNISSSNDIIFQGFNMTNGAFRSKILVINQSNYNQYKSYLH